MTAKPVIHVVACGIGNVRSVQRALDRAGVVPRIVDTPAGLTDAEKVILPGVGAFGACAARLRESGFVPALDEHVLGRRRPFLGICVGMQLLATRGLEFGEHAGLGYVPGDCVQIPLSSPTLRLPQVGWNALEFDARCPLFADLGDDRTAYFVHSYHVVPTDSRTISASVEYGTRVTAAVWRDNVFGVQFHPEKSQDVGLRILRAFARL